MAYYHHHDGDQITKNRTRIAINHLKAQDNFLQANPSIAKQLGKKKIIELTMGELLRRGYDSYWRRDITAARKIFREVMKKRYGSLKDWKYMLRSILPLFFHQAILRVLERQPHTEKK